MVPAGGAVCHTGSYDGPAWVEVFDNKMDGSSFRELFPWELTNTDYFRRVVNQVGYSLQPLVEAALWTRDATHGRGVVVVGAQGKELKAVIDAVRAANTAKSGGGAGAPAAAAAAPAPAPAPTELSLWWRKTLICTISLQMITE